GSAGIYGITTALEMNARRYHVVVLDPGPLPHPLAASTDISKVVRMEYGADETYMERCEARVIFIPYPLHIAVFTKPRGCVIAPSEADETRVAYFAKTPLV